MTSPLSSSVEEWFRKKGITADTLQAAGVFIEDGAVCFPYLDPSGELLGVKRRYGIPEGERSFRWSKGIDPQPYNLADTRFKTLILCEGETDTLKLIQELGPDRATGVLGLPGIETWREDMAGWFQNAERVHVILDNDLDYKVAGRVDEAWRRIRHDLGKRASRLYLPRGVNDVCEFFEDYDLDALRLLASRTPRPGDSRFRTLDLSQPPGPINWLVENFICMGDLHLLMGEPGIGKSWVTMGLAMAIAGEQERFLGKRVARHGRVLYFDEENPEDLVHQRFHKLGFDPASHADKIRYVSNVGLRLDKDPDTALEEALDFEPELIVLDSLTRFHTEEENSSGAMGALYLNALKPLARETGAAVVLIHHANKTDSNSSYKRSRGSGDIPASVDAGFDVRYLDQGLLSIMNFKSRRQAQGDTLYMTLRDTEDGRVLLDGGTDIPVPF